MAGGDASPSEEPHHGTCRSRSFPQLQPPQDLDLLDNLAKQPEPAAVLGWRPGPGRAHIAWQLMHLAATDDRHLNVRMNGGQPKEPELVRRFAGGSVPDDSIPTIEEIRRYLTQTCQELLDHLRKLDAAQLAGKPNAEAPWVYQEWFQLLAWHETHHHGQAHLTFNLYRASQEAKAAVPGQ